MMKTFKSSYIVYFEPETNLWVSESLSCDVASQGKTKEEAIQMLREALELYYEANSHFQTTRKNMDTGELELAL